MAALENILSPQIVQKLGWTLLHFVWQAAAVALILAILLRVLRRSTANLRYIVACSALGLMVLLPAVTIHLVPVSASSAPPNIAAFVLPAEPMSEISPAEIRVAEQLPDPQGVGAASWKQRAAGLLEPALPYAVLGWLIGVVLLAVWHLGGWAQLQRLKRRIVNEADSPLTGRVSELADSLGVKRAVRLLESAFVQVPTVVGWLRPIILLPASALTGLTSEQLEALLAHELAHIKRLDYLVNMLQTAVEILGFYHPAVWWISHTIRAERENCCDDMAVSISGDARQYVKALAEMERIRCGQAELAIAASGGNLSRRISRLLGKDSARKTRAGWAPAAVAAILLIALAIPASLALSGAGSEDTSAAVATTTEAAGHASMEGPLPLYSISDETPRKPQIAFECKFIEVRADSEFVKGKSPGNIIIRLDGEFSNPLEALIRATQGANVLAAPRVIILDAGEATIATGEERTCITGYEPAADGDKKPKPIIENVFCGLELKIEANVVEGNAVHMDIHLTTRSKPAEQKDASGRTIHVTTSSDSTTEVMVNDGDIIIIRGPKADDRPDQTLILQIVPHIIRPDERVGIPAKAGEYPVTMAIKAADYAKAADAKAGQNPFGMAIRGVLDSIDQLTAAGTQIDDLGEVRKILSARGFTIDAANFSGEKCSLLISKPIDDGIEGRLACRVTKQNDRLLIDRIDFETAAPARRGPPPVKPSTSQPTEMTPTPAGPPEADQQASAESITQIFKLKYADCEQAATTLTPLLTSDRKVIIVPEARSNQLIVQATAQDIEQIERLLAEIDVSAGETTVDTEQGYIRHSTVGAPGREAQTLTTEQLRLLEKERKALAEKLQSQHQVLRQLAQEYGTADLTKHQDMKLQRVATLLDTRTKTEARRMQMETELKLLEQTGEQTATPQEQLKMRQDYINNDPTIKALAEKVAQVEMELLLARQTSTESSPEVANKTRLLQALNKRLDELKNEVSRSFDELMAKETVKGKQQKLARLQAELHQLGEYEKQLCNLLNQEDSEIVKLGRKQLDIQDLQRQMDLDQQMYDTVSRRIEELASVTKRTAERPNPEPVPSASPGPVLPAPKAQEN